MWNSLTYGKLDTIEEVISIIRKYIDDDIYCDYELVIGTDSQTNVNTCIVSVISVYRQGRGGIFFYHREHKKAIKNLKHKIHLEIQTSLELASKVTSLLEGFYINEDWSNFEKIKIKIHADLGEAGPTKDLINGVIGWINSMGFDAEIKPNSYCSSSIADKYSKSSGSKFDFEKIN